MNSLPEIVRQLGLCLLGPAEGQDAGAVALVGKRRQAGHQLALGVPLVDVLLLHDGIDVVHQPLEHVLK